MGGNASIASRSGRRRIPVGARTGRAIAANPIATTRAVQTVNRRSARVGGRRGGVRGRGQNLPAVGRSRSVSQAARRRANR